MDWFEIANQIEPDLRKGDTETCINRVVEELKKLPETPFHDAINFKFSNKPDNIADFMRKFIEKEKERIDIKAIYTEMNGFDINTDLWYFDSFAYETYGGRQDYDWLSDWKSDDYEIMTLTGLENIQEVYENYQEDEYEENEGDYSKISGLCSLLIVLYFQDLIKKSARLINELDIPFLATAHDYDFIYEYSK